MMNSQVDFKTTVTFAPEPATNNNLYISSPSQQPILRISARMVKHRTGQFAFVHGPFASHDIRFSGVMLGIIYSMFVYLP